MIRMRIDLLEIVWSGPYNWPWPGRQPRIDALEAGSTYLLTIETTLAMIVGNLKPFPPHRNHSAKGILKCSKSDQKNPNTGTPFTT